MPLSAISPEGPVCLVGMDLATIESLKNRNRRERLFTAKCCGAPVQIRTAVGRVPHFYHLVAAPGCDGARGESAEHLDLKRSIAVAAINAGWDVEVESDERLADGTLVWRADVLARKGKAAVAFEVELSKPDWSLMMERQERYRRSDVRGLWLVKTRKPFPQKQELPVFNVWSDKRNTFVSLERDADWPGTWEGTDDGGSVELRDFIDCALSKELAWAPYTGPGVDMPCDVRVYVKGSSRCVGCNRSLGTPYSVSMAMTLDAAYPRFVWHRSMGARRRSFWAPALAKAVQEESTNSVAVSTPDRPIACRACGAIAQHSLHGNGISSVTGTVQLTDLPAPRLGTIEWNWLNRWALRRKR